MNKQPAVPDSAASADDQAASGPSDEAAPVAVGPVPGEARRGLETIVSALLARLPKSSGAKAAGKGQVEPASSAGGNVVELGAAPKASPRAENGSPGDVAELDDARARRHAAKLRRREGAEDAVASGNGRVAPDTSRHAAARTARLRERSVQAGRRVSTAVAAVWVRLVGVVLGLGHVLMRVPAAAGDGLGAGRKIAARTGRGVTSARRILSARPRWSVEAVSHARSGFAWAAWSVPRLAERAGAGLVRIKPLLVGLGSVGVVVALVVEFGSTSVLYTLFVAASLFLGAICWTTLIWMMDAWRSPESLVATRLEADELETAFSFSLIVPARHEEGVLATTLSRLVTTDHPDFEVIVVVGDDDAPTTAVAERVAAHYPELVRVVVDSNTEKNKPRALNTALPYCKGAVTGVFDAEDDVNPALLKRVDQRFQRTGADVVQAGVQLMNFHSSWLAVRNVLEYYFWFRSRLHVHARQGFIPLGGNTVFVRTEVLRAVGGWDPDCLTEDCELGVRLSSLGAKTVVVYEPDLVTREECPASLNAFVRQRTRWHQGFLQTLARGYWRRLPWKQRALGIYTLAMPYLMAIAWVMVPGAIVTAVVVAAPIPITLLSILPAVPMLLVLLVELAGLQDFSRLYGEPAGWRDYARLVLGLPFYYLAVSFSALRAVVREVLGIRGWEKTTHLGMHLGLQPVGPGTHATAWPHIPSRRSRLPRQRPPRRWRPAVAPPPVLKQQEMQPATVTSRLPLIRIYSETLDNVPRSVAGTLLDRIVAGPASGSAERFADEPLEFTRTPSPEPQPPALLAGLAAVSGPTPEMVASSGVGATRLPRPSLRERLRVRLGSASALRLDLAVLLPLLALAALVTGVNMLHWPGVYFDEGTYVGYAWAVGTHGALANYTYGYGHPPLAWLLVSLWTWASGFGHASYSIDHGRELMLGIALVSCWLVYVLARRLGLGRPFAALALCLFAFSPVSVFFHRLVLLDNFATLWALAAFVLALTPRRRLWAYAGSGACFAASVLSKETILVIFPALVVAVFQSVDRSTRRYCVALFAGFFALLALFYPLYATLKGELLPGRGHVSLIGAAITQLFTRQATGSVFDHTSLSYGTVQQWLKLDPWLVLVALLLCPLMLVRRRIRPVALAFLIQVVMIMRPGYLPAMYVIALLPFAALVVAGSVDSAWSIVLRGREAGEPVESAEGWRGFVAHASRSVRPPTGAVAAVALVGMLAGAALWVVPDWARADRQAMSIKQDGWERSALRWVVAHVPHSQRLLVSDAEWVYLIGHGFNSQPMPGGFFSRTVVSYWPFDYDPAIQKRFPKGWRDFNYIISTRDMRNSLNRTPKTADALAHSRVVASFGRGVNRVEVRKIEAATAVKDARRGAGSTGRREQHRPNAARSKPRHGTHPNQSGG